MSTNAKAQADCFRSTECQCRHYMDCTQHPTPEPLTLPIPSTLHECRPDQVAHWWAAYVSARGG